MTRKGETNCNTCIIRSVMGAIIGGLLNRSNHITNVRIQHYNRYAIFDELGHINIRQQMMMVIILESKGNIRPASGGQLKFENTYKAVSFLYTSYRYTCNAQVGDQICPKQTATHPQLQRWYWRSYQESLRIYKVEQWYGLNSAHKISELVFHWGTADIHLLILCEPRNISEGFVWRNDIIVTCHMLGIDWRTPPHHALRLLREL